jgi:hypothetical protein
MNVPIQLSSQLDECLKELTMRKDAVLNQIFIYESANRASMQTEQKNLDNLEINSLDSNYESDNNSVKSFQSKNIYDSNQTNVKPLSLEAEFQIECKITGFNLHNSDDSDATVNEIAVSNETNMTKVIPNISIKKLKINNEKPINHSSSTSSDSTTTPGSPKTPTPYSLQTAEKNDKKKENLETEPSLANESLTIPSEVVENTMQIKKSILNFSRQISDGYSSSNTPLSASSINESVNPFFQQQND